MTALPKAKLPETASAATREEAIAELLALVTDLRDAAQDGRMLARQYSDVLRDVVDEYCLEFEKRAEAVLSRLEDAS